MESAQPIKSVFKRCSYSVLDLLVLAPTVKCTPNKYPLTVHVSATCIYYRTHCNHDYLELYTQRSRVVQLKDKCSLHVGLRALQLVGSLDQLFVQSSV